MARQDKATAVDELTAEFQGSTAAVLTEYRGLTVAQLKTLRRSLGDNASYVVVKNTLTKIAAERAGVEGLSDLLAGPSAIAFVKGDPVDAAKGLRDFAKEHPLLVIKGGYMDGAVLSAQEIAKIADLESREVLLSKLAGAMKASLTQAAGLFQAPLAQTARLLGALQAKAEADPSAIGGAGAPEAAIGGAGAPEAAIGGAGAPEAATEGAGAVEADATEADATEAEAVEADAAEPEAVEAEGAEESDADTTQSTQE